MCIRDSDRPADGVFVAQDFRVRLELTGKGASARKLSDGRFALRAGKHEIVVYPAESEFAGQDTVWKHEQKEDAAVIEGVCYSGPSKKFDFSLPIEMKLGFGIQLRQSADESKTKLPTLQSKPGKVIARWDVEPVGKSNISEMIIAVPNGKSR